MVNGPKHYVNLHDSTIIIVNNYCAENWVGKSPSQLICQIWGLAVNTFTADDKYSFLKKDNLTQPIQTQL